MYVNFADLKTFGDALDGIATKAHRAFKRADDRRIDRFCNGPIDGPAGFWNLVSNTWAGRIILLGAGIGLLTVLCMTTRQQETHSWMHKPISMTVSTEYYYWEGDVWAMYLTPNPLVTAQQETGVSAQAPASSHYSLDNDATQQVAPEFTPTR